jgi:hypothetical protein
VREQGDGSGRSGLKPSGLPSGFEQFDRIAVGIEQLNLLPPLSISFQEQRPAAFNVSMLEE